MTKMTSDVLINETRRSRSDPFKCLDLAEEYIRQNPSESFGYFVRHQMNLKLGQPWAALSDVNKALSIKPDSVAFHSRGCVYRELGEYQKALDDFDRALALNPVDWAEGIFPLFRADCHARLGNEAAALAECARLTDDYWAPSVFGLPGGDKEQATAEIRRRVAAARRGSKA